MKNNLPERTEILGELEIIKLILSIYLIIQILFLTLIYQKLYEKPLTDETKSYTKSMVDEEIIDSSFLNSINFLLKYKSDK